MFGARLLVGMAGFPAPVPHTRTAPLAASASSTELATVDRRGARHPPGAGGHPGRPRATGWATMGVPTIGLWARVPHYAAGLPYPDASIQLLDGLARVTGAPGRRPRPAGGGRGDPPPARRPGVQQRPAPHADPPAGDPVRRRGREPERDGRRLGQPPHRRRAGRRAGEVPPRPVAVGVGRRSGPAATRRTGPRSGRRRPGGPAGRRPCAGRRGPGSWRTARGGSPARRCR